MTRAPRSASWRVQKGAAIACSSAMTVMPSRGLVMEASERAGQAEDVLRDVAVDQVGRDRRHLVEARLAELALDIVLVREPEATVRLQADVRRLERRLGGEVLRHVRLGATGLVRIEQLARAKAHEVGGLD